MAEFEPRSATWDAYSSRAQTKNNKIANRGVQSTKPKIVKLPTGTDKRDKEEDGLLEQQEPPRPSVLNDWNEYVGAHVVDFTALKGYSNGPMWKISNNIQLRNEIHLCLIRL